MISIKKELALVKFLVNNDFKTAINAFCSASKANNNKAGCYSLLRIIFPLIDHMAQLVAGKTGNHSKTLKQYLYNYMGKINQRYKQCAGLLVYMYRHGLLHQMQPNRIKYKGAIAEWNLYYRENYNCHLVCKKEGVRKKRLYFDIEQFAKDFLESVSFYETELGKKRNKTLRNNLINALNEQYKALDIKSHSKPWLSSDDFSILG